MSSSLDRPQRQRATRRRAAARRRRAALLALVLVAIGVVALTNARSSPKPVQSVDLVLDGGVVGHVRIRDARGGLLTVPAVARALPPRLSVRRGAARIVFAVDRRGTAAAALRSDGQVRPFVRPVSAAIAAPVVAQRLRDNCETAALQVLLATMGQRRDQLVLQRRLPRSGPLDPTGTAEAPVWGDPDEGYVGRADGSGSWGGFGVYPGPIARLAAREGARVDDLTGASPATLYSRLLSGHAVLAWVGLGDGPYRSWTSPSGNRITVNLNEHTIVLTGVRTDGSLTVVNVLNGTSETWTRERFEQAWALLGHRALAAA